MEEVFGHVDLKEAVVHVHLHEGEVGHLTHSDQVTLILINKVQLDVLLLRDLSCGAADR
jgi:hypothetical protein